MAHLLEIKNLKAKVIDENKMILKGVNLTVNEGEIHAIMGPNGSGKSTLANVIMGNPKFEITEGEILFKGQSILDLDTAERAKLGLFMSFQSPEEIEGVKTRQLLLNSYRNIKSEDDSSALKVNKKIMDLSDVVSLDKVFLDRYVNTGFSGGEKKKSEILQMGLLSPKLTILDEIDSGLDVDALKIVSESINKFKNENMGMLIITHYQRILNYIKPDFVHVYYDGKIISTGDADLAKEIEEKGYTMIKEEEDA
jgi:Fe-S cluster assembly ATP-binding protein